MYDQHEPTIMNVKENQYAIFASNNNPAHEVMKTLVDNDIFFKVALGSYKGKPETSYVINSDNLEKVRRLGLLVGEESVLLLSSMNGLGVRKAFLALRTENYTNGKLIGDYKEVTKEEAMKHDGWTYDTHQKTYFVAA